MPVSDKRPSSERRGRRSLLSLDHPESNRDETSKPPRLPRRPGTRGAPTVVAAEFCMPFRQAAVVDRPIITHRVTPLAATEPVPLPRVSTAPTKPRPRLTVPSSQDEDEFFPPASRSTPVPQSPPGLGERPPRRLVSRGRIRTGDTPAMSGTPTRLPRSSQPLSSAGHNRGSQQHFHRGLVNALQDVLRQQRQGVFAGLGQPQSSSSTRPLTRGLPETDVALTGGGHAWRRSSGERLGCLLGRSDGDTDGLSVDTAKNTLQEEAASRRSISLQWQRELEQLSAAHFSKAGDIHTAGPSSVAAPPPADDPVALRTEGNEHYQARRFIAAHECYTRAIRLEPENTVLLTNRAAVYTMLLDYDASIRDCLRATKLDPSSWKGFARMARAHALKGQHTAAARHYSTAILLLEQDLYRGDEADRLARHLEQIRSERGALQHLERAKYEMDRKNYRAAAQRLCEAETYVEEPPVRLLRAAALLHFDPTRARSEITRHLASMEQPPTEASKTDPRHQELLSSFVDHYCDTLVVASQASLHCGVHFLNIAVSHLELCLSIRPTHPNASKYLRSVVTFEDQLARGNELAEAGRHSDAAQAFSNALSLIESTNFKVRILVSLQRAESFVHCGMLREALQDCDDVLKLDSNSVKGLTKRSRVHEGLLNFQAALLDMEHAALLNTELADELVALRMRVLQRQQQFKPESGSSSRDSIATPPSVAQPSHYEILGLHPSIDSSAIRAAYRKLTLQLHPDKVVKESPEVRRQCEVRFKQVAHAYSVLSDPALRFQYDLTLR